MDKREAKALKIVVGLAVAVALGVGAFTYSVHREMQAQNAVFQNRPDFFQIGPADPEQAAEAFNAQVQTMFGNEVPGLSVAELKTRLTQLGFTAITDGNATYRRPLPPCIHTWMVSWHDQGGKLTDITGDYHRACP